MSVVALVHLLTSGVLRHQHNGVNASRKFTVGSLHSAVGIPAHGHTLDEELPPPSRGEVVSK